MKIHEVKDTKRTYLDLLLLGDEDEKMIERYLDRGRLFVLDDGDVRAVCVVTDEGNGTLEIKNLAVKKDYRGRGYGRAMIEFVKALAIEGFSLIKVGTGDSPLTVPFYEKCGFTRSYVVKNFFSDNYDHPIYEGGILLTDMVYLSIEV